MIEPATQTTIERSATLQGKKRRDQVPIHHLKFGLLPNFMNPEAQPS